MHERRKESRVRADGVRARVRLGHRLVILDVSPRGALVEGQNPLRPGSRIDVQIESEMRRDMVAARVIRCGVVAIDAESGVTYRAGLSFNESCEWVRAVATHDGYAMPADGAPGQSADVASLPVVCTAEQK